MKNNYKESQCLNRGHWGTDGCKDCTHLSRESREYYCRDNGSCTGHMQHICQVTGDLVTFVGDCPVQSQIECTKSIVEDVKLMVERVGR